MSGFLAGKVALVTGSSRGIGRAIALALAEAGADVAVHGRRPAEEGSPAADVRDRVRALGRRAECFAGDIAVKAEVEALMGAVGAAFGRLDVLGNLWCVQKALPWLAKQGGDVVHISSLGSRFMNPEYPLGIAKAAMEAFTRQWAEELAPKGVRSNGVCAGLVKTDAFKTLRLLRPELDQTPEDLFVTPEEVADVVLFLVSPAARAIRGQTIVADKGASNRLNRAGAQEVRGGPSGE